MKAVPIISIIIPLYNKGPYIRRALESILLQRIQNYEVIIIDGGSTDESLDVIKEYMDDNRFRLIHQKDRGVSSARNIGINNARSELVAFLDADDEWLPIHLETILSLRQKYPYAGAYTTSYIFFEEHGKIIKPRYREIPPAPWEGIIPNYFRSALGDAPIWTSVVCIPKAILIEVGCFNPDSCFGEDLDLWGRIALKYPIAFSSKLGGIYHKECENRICTKACKIQDHPFCESVRKAFETNKIPVECRTDIINCAAMYEIACGIHNISAGFKNEGRRILKRNMTGAFHFERIILLVLSYLPESLFNRIVSLKTGKSQ